MRNEFVEVYGMMEKWNDGHIQHSNIPLFQYSIIPRTIYNLQCLMTLIKNILTFILIGLPTLFLFSCGQQANDDKHFKKLTENTEVIMKTPLGDLRFLLYKKTPVHKEHFKNLVKQGLLNKSKLHLIIPDYTIQCGYEYEQKRIFDKKEQSDMAQKKIPPEIHADFIHKKGALAASRLPNEANPEKNSDPFQFYIVLGTPQSDFELDLVEKKINQQIFFEYFSRTHPFRADTFKNPSDERLKKYKTQYDKLYQREFSKFKEEFHYTNSQRELYKTSGGLPKLDQSYTIFGELIEGQEILDSLCTVPIDEQRKPLENIEVKWILLE